MKEGKNGVTANTPKNILFGAGTVHKNLVYSADTSTWNFEESIIGATNGGSKLSIVPEVTTIEVDGPTVAIKGLKKKTGETATMEINLAELSEEMIKAATFGTNGVSEDVLYNLIESKVDIEEGDYFDNVAFVGETLDGRNIIVILPNALCTSGYEQEGKNKEGSIGAFTFECHAGMDSDLTSLPWKIYYPKPTV